LPNKFADLVVSVTIKAAHVKLLDATHPPKLQVFWSAGKKSISTKEVPVDTTSNTVKFGEKFSKPTRFIFDQE
jgi:hypothetical protein